MIVPGPEALERICMILIAIVFFMAMKALQNVQADLSEIKTYVESVGERVTRLEQRGF